MPQGADYRDWNRCSSGRDFWRTQQIDMNKASEQIVLDVVVNL